jgi:fucose permease
MLGMVDGALGVAWPSIAGEFSRPISDLGFLLVAGGVGYLTASFSYGRLHDRFGTASLLVSGAGLLALGMAGIATASTWPLVVVSPLFLGLGGGLVDTGMNAHAALAFDIRQMSLLHACYGMGATLGPLVITASLANTGVWRSGYGGLAVAQLLIGTAIWFRRRNWLDAEQARSTSLSSPRRRSVYLIALFLLYTGVEVGAGQWSFTLLAEGRGLPIAVAGAWVSAYWGGLVVGRLATGLVGGRMKPTAILNGGILLALVGFGLFWADPGGAGVIGLPLAGFGLGPIFPTLVSLTPERIGRDRSTRSIGYQLAAANIGGSVVPLLIGLVAGAAGLETLAGGIFAFASVLTIVMLISEREARKANLRD